MKYTFFEQVIDSYEDLKRFVLSIVFLVSEFVIRAVAPMAFVIVVCAAIAGYLAWLFTVIAVTIMKLMS